MRKTAFIACVPFALAACEVQNEYPSFKLSDGTLECSGGESSIKVEKEVLEAFLVGTLGGVRVLGTLGVNGIPVEPALAEEFEYERAARACANFLLMTADQKETNSVEQTNP